MQFILLILYILLQSIYPPTITLIKYTSQQVQTLTCFGTGVPSSGSYKKKGVQGQLVSPSFSI